MNTPTPANQDASKLESYRAQTAGLDAGDVLAWVQTTFGAGAVFTTSFGAEDQVLVDLLSRHAPLLSVATIDTGRLPEETYVVLDAVRERYGQNVQVFAPSGPDLEAWVSEHGPNAFRNSVELRKSCCNIRKVRPLARLLEGRQAWVSGLRRDQGPTRAGTQLIEYDEVRNLYKIQPLADWTQDDVWRYLREHKVPYNALHDRGYPSIGCAPCTRAIKEGEDERAGRWWWESPDHKECGLHTHEATGNNQAQVIKIQSIGRV